MMAQRFAAIAACALSAHAASDPTRRNYALLADRVAVADSPLLTCFASLDAHYVKPSPV